MAYTKDQLKKIKESEKRRLKKVRDEENRYHDKGNQKKLF